MINLEQFRKPKNTLHDREIHNVQDKGHYEFLYHVRGIFLGELYTQVP